SRDDRDPGWRGLRGRRSLGRDGAAAGGGRGRKPRHRACSARGRLVAVRISRRSRTPFLPAADRRERCGPEDRDRPDETASGFVVKAVRRPAGLSHYKLGGEDGWSLYGFHDEAGRRFFQRLIGVSGVGPKIAIALMSEE